MIRRASCLLVFLLLASLPAWADPAPIRLEPTAEEFADLVRREETLWYGVYMSGMKLGHAKSSLTRKNDAVTTVMDMELAFLSMGVQGRLDLREETRFQTAPPYALLSASTRDSRGRSVTVTRQGQEFQAVITEAGGARTERLGSLDYNLLDALMPDLWLRRAPQAGERAAFRHLDLETRQVAIHETTMLEERQSLVEGVPVTWRMAEFLIRPENVRGRYVTDERGQMLSMTLPGDLELRLEPEDVARRRDLPRDLFVMGLAKTDRPLGDPAGARRAVLRASGPGAAALADGPRQRLVAAGEAEATIVLGEGIETPETEPEKHLGRGRWFDPTDPQVKALAAKAVGNAAEPRDKAVRLVAFVRDFVKDQPSPEPRRVREIMADPRGDCTEHALLFTALARAAGLPAREVYGLSYMGDQIRAFGGHAWAEVVLDGRWVEVDPTYGQTPPDAFHVRLGAGEEGAASFVAAYRGLSFAVEGVER